MESELKALKDNRKKGKTIYQDSDGCIDKCAAGIKRIIITIQKMITTEEANPMLMSQIERLQEYSDKIVRAVKKETSSVEQGRIVELQKQLENVMTQAKEIEKENVKIRKHYSDKLTECNKLMQEQSIELQTIRKKLESSRQDLNKAKGLIEDQEKSIQSLQKKNKKLTQLAEHQEKLIQYLRDTIQKTDASDNAETFHPSIYPRESKSENMSMGSSLGVRTKYQHDLTNFDIEMDEYNNEHNPCIHVETSNSLYEPHYRERLFAEDKSLLKNKSLEQMGIELGEEYTERKLKDKNTEIPFYPNTERFGAPIEILKENINSNTATFRDQKLILTQSHTKTEILKDEIDELNNEIKNLQDKINTAIKKKKQNSS